MKLELIFIMDNGLPRQMFIDLTPEQERKIMKYYVDEHCSEIKADIITDE